MTTMDWIFVTAAVLGTWVLMSLTGYERQRRLDNIALPILPANADEHAGATTDHGIPTATPQAVRKAA